MSIAKPTPAASPGNAPGHWLLVLALVGLDYFSTLAYLPSIAAEAAGPLAPLAALVIVAVTLLLAVPLYMYVVGRSPHGQGASGLIERTVHGWRGKVLVLVLMGFVAADFVITRSLSVADASTHVLHNPHFQSAVEQHGPQDPTIEKWLGPGVWRRVEPYWTRRMALTIGLSVLAFGFWFWLHGGFTRKVLRLAVVVVTLYLVLSGIVIGSGLWHLWKHPQLVQGWWNSVVEHGGGVSRLQATEAMIWSLLSMSLVCFPQLALGLSGFELTISIAPLVKGRDDDQPEHPRGRIRNVRKLMFAAALVMSLFLLGAVLVTSLLVPSGALAHGGLAQHRALAYLAHGGALSDVAEASQRIVGGSPAQTGEPPVLRTAGGLNPWFGDWFGTLYDASSVIILCLAGASVMIGLRDLVPQFLHRMGMELDWAHRVGVMLHLFNVIILLVTVAFQASVSAQQWAYATSVLALLSGASIAAVADLRHRWRGRPWRPLLLLPFTATCGFFLSMAGLTMFINASGLAIAMLFVATIFTTSFISRWIRSTELRFSGFEFANEESRQRWKELCQLETQFLVPHRPGHFTLADKHADIRKKFRLPPEMPVLFIESHLGDTSDFYHKPRMRIDREGDLEVIRVRRCVSVAHVIAAIGLEMCKVGAPPEIYFGWSHETPLAANLNFLLLGQGNVPWMVKELLHKAEPNPDRQPRIIVG